MPEPVCDLVLGNIDGVRSPENPDIIWFHEKEGNNSSMVVNNVAEASKQNKMKDKENTLVVPSSTNQIPDNNLVRLQAEDISLTLTRTGAEKSDIRVHTMLLFTILHYFELLISSPSGIMLLSI